MSQCPHSVSYMNNVLWNLVSRRLSQLSTLKSISFFMVKNVEFIRGSLLSWLQGSPEPIFVSNIRTLLPLWLYLFVSFDPEFLFY